MKILAVDTSTECCGVAVMDAPAVQVHTVFIGKETHSKHLLLMIDEAFRLAGLNLADMEGMVVTRGPGSFTGLRIGLSTIKGLSVAGDKPVTTVSSLDALACQFLGNSLPVCVLLDARKEEVYTCRYRVADMILEKITAEQVLSPEEAVSGMNAPCLFVGNGAMVYRKVIEETAGANAIFAPVFQNFIRPEIVAYLGQQRLDNNEVDDPEKLVPVYIRQPDAVVQQKKPQGVVD